MKKSLIALAVAGTFAAPAAFAATANVDIYGRMNIAIQDTNGTNNNMDVVSNVSRFGFKGSEDLGGGLKALWQIEQQFDANGGNTTAFGGSGMRNTFVGLAGGFGTALLGRHDTPYKIATGKYDIFADTIGDYNGRAMNANTVDLVNSTHDARADNAIAYISPNFSGLTIAAAIVTSMDHLNQAGKEVDAVSLAGMYANGPLTVDVAYQDVEAVNNGSTAWKLGAGYTFGDIKVGFVYEDIDNSTGNDRDSWLINGVYSMGPIALKAQYGRVDVQNQSGNNTAWMLGADYSLSKRTTAYFVYSRADDKAVANKGNGFNIGMSHNF